MSQENVETVQRLYEYLNQGDIDAALAVLDPAWNGGERRYPRHGDSQGT